MMRCIITGCALIHPNGRWLPVDLFTTDDGGTYIANGPATDKRETPFEDWNRGIPHYSKTITMTNWWERRGVFVIEKHDAFLNQLAIEYIKGL